MDLSTVRFGIGSHSAVTIPTGKRDMCFMEAVAFMAGEAWSDAPACASPVISAFLRSWNDALSDEDRDRLLPAEVWVPRIIGSRGDDNIEEQRSYLVLDWFLRTHTPTWMALAPSLAKHVIALRAAAAVHDIPTARAVGDIMLAARTDAWWVSEVSAVFSGTEAALRESAGASALCSMVDVSPRSTTWDAAWEASWIAAWDATSLVARKIEMDLTASALRPTVEVLQQSAIDLLERILAVQLNG